MEAIASRLEAIASRVETITSRVEAIASRWRPSLAGWRPSLVALLARDLQVLATVRVDPPPGGGTDSGPAIPVQSIAMDG